MGTGKLKIMKKDIIIENLKCGGCVATIKKGILAINGVLELNIDLEKSIVSFVSEKDNFEEVKAKLSQLGYPEVGNKNTIVHKAKSFVSCAVARIDS